MVNFTRTEDRRQRTEKIKGKCKNKSYGSPTKTLGDDGYGFPTRTLGNDKSGDRGRKKARTKTGSPTKTLGDDGIKARLKAYLYLPIN